MTNRLKSEDMTDKEKAEEIISTSNTNQVYDVVDFNTLHECLYEDLMEMAEWKDAQIKSHIEKAFGCMIFRQDHSLSNKEHQYIDLDIVQNIIESFFHIKLDGYDK